MRWVLVVAAMAAGGCVATSSTNVETGKRIDQATQRQRTQQQQVIDLEARLTAAVARRRQLFRAIDEAHADHQKQIARARVQSVRLANLREANLAAQAELDRTAWLPPDKLRRLRKRTAVDVRRVRSPARRAELKARLAKVASPTDDAISDRNSAYVELHAIRSAARQARRAQP